MADSEPERTGTIAIELDYSPRVTYALQQNDVPVIRELRIQNTGPEPLTDLRVVIQVASGLAKPWEAKLLQLSGETTRRLNHIDFALESEVLANLLERQKTDLSVDVWTGERKLASAAFPVEVLAFNEWPGLAVLPEIIAAFVCPNHPAIESQLESLRATLREWTGDPSLNGYQAGSLDRCYKLVAATYEAMKALRIGYINPPASFEQGGQKIRTPDQVLGGAKLGTCLDLAVVAAALMEQIGLHPIIMLVKGHAFVGAWLQDTSFSEPVVDDAARIGNRVELNEIAVFEATAVVDGKDVPFEAAAAMARRHLENAEEFQAAVDIAAARRARILPLPPRLQSGDGFVVVEQKPVTAVEPGPSRSVPTLDHAPPPRTVQSRNQRGAVIELPEDALKRLDRWKRKLLDLSLRNPLLNFKPDSKRAVGLYVPDVARLEDRLVEGDSFALLPRSGVLDDDGPRDLSLETQRTGRDIPVEILEQEFDRKLIRVDAVDGFETRVVELYRNARTSLEETGSSTLYLALGLLKWFETDRSEQARYAPLILMPVKLERPYPNQFRLAASDDEPRVNMTLIEKLRQDFDLKAEHLSELEEDESGINVPLMFRGFREVIKDTPRWEVREQAFVGHFSFAKFVLWTDLDKRLDQVAGNPTVKYILTRSANGAEYRDFPSEDMVDRLPPEQTSLCPLDADSSQQTAIEAAIAGKTFVLQGPPGTGKSQTITNMIARAAASGKRVLFVAEKLAALSVVRRRLQKVALGPFVFELHSNKVGKKEVLEQLRASIDAAVPGDLANWEEEIESLASLRQKLNDYVRALHVPRTSGETVYQVISRVNSLADVPMMECRFDGVAGTTAQQLKSYRQVMGDAVGAARSLGGVAAHPLQGIRATQWRLDLAERAREAINSGLTVAGVLRTAVNEWLVHLGYSPEEAGKLRVAEFAPLYHLTKALLQREHASTAVLDPQRGETYSNMVSSITARGRERDAIRARLADTYRAEFLDANHQGWIDRLNAVRAAHPLIRWFKRRALLREARALAQATKALTFEQFGDDCASALRAKELSSRITVDAPSIPDSARVDWAALDAEAAWATSVHQLIQKCAGGAVASDRIRVAVAALFANERNVMRKGATERHAAESFVEAVQAFQRALKALEKTLAASTNELTGRNLASAVATFEATLSRWLNHLPALPDWIAWQCVIQQPESRMLQVFFTAMERGELSHDKAKQAFEMGYARSWLDVVLASEPALNRFTCESRARLVEEFRAADRRVMKLSERVMARRLASQRPATSMQTANASSELGLLRRQLQLQRNHKSVRRLVKELPSILPKLKPIWLMSPLSVAQFLDPATPPFDLVVFDEASQIPVWDAVGALARGAKAIVVGDSKQLPPTNFFQRQEEGRADEEENEVEELESILDECIAASIPELRLRWHYRSRHESLIAFSNQQYYDNHLHTFPSAEESTHQLGVSMRFLPDGAYDRGGSRTNRAEALAIVDEIFKRLSAGQLTSIGVVTFSTAQRQLIEDLIDARLVEHPSLKRYFDAKESEYVFVKNLENVQGDERDVIFFSICYGKTESGRLSLGFGPLNRDGGERRLNVAITRARVQVVVFTSIKSEQINLSQSRSRGLADLKSFLDYAERGPRALMEILTVSAEDQFDSPFEQEVCRTLRDRGWSVDTQVGCSGYRIDMAVRDPVRPGRYLLGIECDGASYHSAASARDRDRLREQVLRGLGWTLHRVWSTDWLQNRQRSLARILAALDAAKQRANDASAVVEPAQSVQAPPDGGSDTDIEATNAAPSQRSDPQFAGEQSNAPVERSRLPGEVVYRTHAFGPGRRDPNHFYESDANQLLCRDVSDVIIDEGPIHVSELESRVARAWGLQRVTKRVQDRLRRTQRALGLHPTDGFFRTEGGLSAGHFRTPIDGEQRPLEYVAPEEIRAAISAITATQGTLPQEELEREVAKLFGFSRARESTREVIRAVIGP